MKRLLACTWFLVFSCSAATLVHDYNLTKSLNDIIGSANLNSDGGSITPAGYVFDPNQGLNVSSALANTADYSILTDFSFSDLSNYKKILDFLDRTSDAGFYTRIAALNFFPAANGGEVLTPDTQARVVLTRDGGTSLVNGYFNGVLQFAFTDTSSIAVFGAPFGLIRFFEDDFSTGQGEASAGTATRISIYDGALTAAEAARLGSPSLPSSSAPEPSTFLLFGTGLAGFVM